MEISELLARRTDLSTFVVHLTRRTQDGRSARDNLRNILKTTTIQARSPFGSAAAKLRPGPDLDSQMCVSFSETPLEHIHFLTQDIPKRRFRLSACGLAFTKLAVRKQGANPVWYVDITPGHDWLMKPVEKLVDYAIEHRKRFRDYAIAKLAPFIEQMGSGVRQDGYGYRKEFWWEREWRHQGDFHFLLSEVAFGLVPEKRIEEFEEFTKRLGRRRVPFLDPRWSLERMIAHLCGCVGAITPFDEQD